MTFPRLLLTLPVVALVAILAMTAAVFVYDPQVRIGADGCPVGTAFWSDLERRFVCTPEHPYTKEQIDNFVQKLNGSR